MKVENISHAQMIARAAFSVHIDLNIIAIGLEWSFHNSAASSP